MVSCEVDSTIRDFVDGQTNWELWDVRDFSKKVRELEIGKARALVEQHFGPDWRKVFLGLGSLSPFLTAEQFFSRFLKQERLFNHAWRLVGRTDALVELMAFIAGQQSRVGILPGRGGIGKTKILHALSEGLAHEHPRMLVWFVQEGVPLTPGAFDELPLRPTLIIVDDAHRRDDLSLLFAHVARPENRIKLLLATRMHGIDGIRSALSRAGYDVSETITFPELRKLNREGVRALASQALGPEFEHLANQLAQATRDCPLVTVVGGKLLAQRAVAPELLESDLEFQHAVLDRFGDELLGNVCADDPTCHELLKLISATAPVFVEDKPFLEHAANFLEKTPEWIVVRLGELEKAGVLLRRGRLLRITPDVLSDHLLARACLSASGATTGYADRVFARFAEWRPDRVLQNLAELDWRVAQVKGTSTELLANIWKSIENEFTQGEWSKRYQILAVLKAAAYFQPEPALRVTRAAIRMCAERQRKRRTGTFGPVHVLRVIPEVLKRVAFTIEFLPECCEFLWLIGRSDKRELNPYPEHAVRVLQDLASYKTNKPPQFNQLILECAVRWLGDPKLHEYAHLPFPIIDKLLEKKGESTWSEGAKLIISPFLVSSEKTKAIREKAIAALSTSAQTARPDVAIQALESLRKVLHDDLGRRYKEDEAERARFRAQVAEECKGRFRKAELLLKVLNHGLQQLERAGCSTWPQHLIAAIVSKNSKLGVGVAKAIIRNPDSAAGQYFFVVTGTLQQDSPDAIAPLLEVAAKTKSPRLRFALAHHFWSSRLEKLPGTRELGVLRKLTRHRDANAARLAIESLKSLGRHHPDEALKLLIESKFETNSVTAEAACGCLHKKFGIDPAKVSDPKLKRLVAQLSSVPDIEGHWIQEFLSYAATRIPLAVVDLFVRRIANGANRRTPEYRPLPFQLHVRLDQISKHPDFVPVLCRIRDLTLKRQWQYPRFAAELFWRVAADERAFDVLQEWLDSKEEVRICATAKLLEKAGRNFIFTNPDFVAVALHKAHEASDECYRTMRAFLDSSATSGSKSGTPGEPMPRDVEIKNRATQMVERFAADPVVSRFYDALRREAEAEIQRHRHEFEEQFDTD